MAISFICGLLELVVELIVDLRGFAPSMGGNVKVLRLLSVAVVVEVSSKVILFKSFRNLK